MCAREERVCDTKNNVVCGMWNVRAMRSSDLVFARVFFFITLHKLTNLHGEKRKNDGDYMFF